MSDIGPEVCRLLESEIERLRAELTELELETASRRKQVDALLKAVAALRGEETPCDRPALGSKNRKALELVENYPALSVGEYAERLYGQETKADRQRWQSLVHYLIRTGRMMRNELGHLEVVRPKA